MTDRSPNLIPFLPDLIIPVLALFMPGWPRTGRAEYLNATDTEALKAAYELTRLEGIIPALESAHALAVLGKLNLKKDDIVVVNISGRGDKDMLAYSEALKMFT